MTRPSPATTAVAPAARRQPLTPANQPCRPISVPQPDLRSVFVSTHYHPHTYSRAGITRCMCHVTGQPPALAVHLAAGQPACKARAPKPLTTEALSHLNTCALVTTLCFSLPFTLPGTCPAPSSPHLLTSDPPQHSLEGAFPHPAARDTRLLQPSRLAHHLLELHHLESTSPSPPRASLPSTVVLHRLQNGGLG